MCYRCEICRTLTRPGTPRRVHTVYREVPAVKDVLLATQTSPIAHDTQRVRYGGLRQEIAREIAVCSDCWQELQGGVPLVLVIRRRGVPLGKTAPAPQPDFAEYPAETFHSEGPPREDDNLPRGKPKVLEPREAGVDVPQRGWHDQRSKQHLTGRIKPHMRKCRYCRDVHQARLLRCPVKNK